MKNRTKPSHRIIAIFLTINFLTSLIPSNFAFAGNNGPGSPEAAGFEPVDATDMVNLSNGDLSYVLPLMSVEGFPINLSYHAGMTMDMDASWVGLGWYLNPGAINRSVTGTPDDWKSGVGINFNSYYKKTDYYGITVDVGLPGATVGVGMNWGGGQGLSGSVRASIGLEGVTGGLVSSGVSASASTTGNVSVGASVGVSIGSIGAGASVSYSLNQNKLSGGIGVGVAIEGGGFVGMGLSSSGGLSVGGGGKNNTGNKANGNGGGVGMSSDSFSAGDASIDSQSSGIALPLHFVGVPITIGFRKSKVKINIKKGYRNQEWGALYSSDFSELTSDSARVKSLFPSIHFDDYVVRTNSMDTYSVRLPQSEVEFIGDYTKDIENINFTFLGYDSYDVAAQGLIGNLTPLMGKNATIYGKGQRLNSGNKELHAFWHHGKSVNSVDREFGRLSGTNQNYSSNDLYFYFDGQFTNSEINDTSNLEYSQINSANDLNQLITEGNQTGFSTTSPYGRAKSPNFVEVFTNKQIFDGHAKSRGLISPSNISDNLRGNKAHFDPNGIGAYKVTAADGKTYHFSLPVYHYEHVSRMQIDDFETGTYNDIQDVNEKRQYSRYATHWLLTAITGSDYIDRPDSGNSLNTFNKEDYGYWVELEYGKWSDGYVWRAPYKDKVYNYNTNVKGNIQEKDKGNYSFGRKQLYYLDKINTKNKTALFVKDIRYDAIGKDLKYRFSNLNQPYATRDVIGNTGSGANTSSLNYTNSGVIVREPGVSYKREYSLKLSKIVLVNSDIGKSLSKNSSSNDLNHGDLYSSLGYVPNDTNSPGWYSQDFKDLYWTNSSTPYSYIIHNELGVLDVSDVSEQFIEENALKVVEFNHSYDLAKNSPSSEVSPNSSIINGKEYGNTEKGRLTLESVQLKGKGGAEYLPATKFDYYMRDLNNLNFNPIGSSVASIQNFIDLKNSKVDAWGFLQDTNDYQNENEIKAWSLKDITLPTGAKIEIDYEEDDYWTEAFSRRYWTKDLAVSFNETAGGYQMKIQNHYNIDPGYLVDDFNDYFQIGERVFLDLWLCYKEQDGGGNDRGFIDIRSDDTVTVQSISTNTAGQQILTLFVQDTGAHTLHGCPSYGDCRLHLPFLDWMDNTAGYRKTSGNYPAGFPQNNSMVATGNRFRGGCPGNNDIPDSFNLMYKLLANRVPEDETGGGLRIKELRTYDNNNVYKVQYDYSHPTKGGSSGITSYAPVNGLKFIPYETEIPSPGVMYEYVTMKETANNGEYYSKTRYRHHVLKPVYDIFNPNIEMEALDSHSAGEDRIFWANVSDNYGGFNGTNSKKIKAKKIDININSALIGQLKSVENINSEGQVLLKTENEYINGTILASQEPNKGYTKETYNSMKTIFETNKDDDSTEENEAGTQILGYNRLLSVSSKTKYNNMLKKTSTIGGGFKYSVEYSDVDPWLSSFRKSKSSLSDGSFVMDIRVPAYEKYPQMQSKVLNNSNKHMLTQQAMSISSWSTYGNTYGWKTLNANITTWDDDWPYRDFAGNEINESGVWRKHKSYVWKDDILDPEKGTYYTTVDNNYDYFDWGLGQPTSSKWQNVSEITRYTHWSSPIESKDINNNFSSSKMADNYSKVVAGGNASYTEMFASGAEYDIDGTFLDQEIKGAELRDQFASHTGKYSLKVSAGDKGFLTNLKASEHSADNYKISVWVNSSRAPEMMKISVNGNLESFNGEVVRSGEWYQLNHYKYFDANAKEVYITVANEFQGVFVNIDDYRLHPVYSSMNTYVYDEDTDELTYLLDANNMGTKYVYDKAGRLCRQYSEVEANSSINGGFKLMSQYNYNYKDQPSSTDCMCCEDDAPQALSSSSYFNINGIKEKDEGAYKRLFSTDVSGDSNDYSYEWRWLIDYETNTYSNFTAGTNVQDIPFAVKNCDVKSNSYDKVWMFEVKVSDNTTGQSKVSSEKVELSGCKFVYSDSKWADLEISSNYQPCSPNTKYSFRPFVIRPEHDNYSYSYRSFDHGTNLWGAYQTINSEKGNFCVQEFYAPSGNCKTEYSLLQTFQYRVIDNNSGEIYQSNVFDTYLDCVIDPEESLKLLNSEYHAQYNSFGSVVEKTVQGEIVFNYNFLSSLDKQRN